MNDMSYENMKPRYNKFT